MKHTRQDLKIMQGWSLERKIRVTQTRIMEWYMRYDGQVFISFSGGKDSTVLLDLARRVYLKMTGIPYAPIYGDIVESRKKNGTPILKTTGVSRSGCMYCMYGVHLEHEPNRFQLMQVTHPQQYDYCINKLGCGAVLDYIGVPYRNQQLEVDHC